MGQAAWCRGHWRLCSSPAAGCGGTGRGGNWARWESFNLEAGVASVGLLLLMAVVPFLAVLELDQAGPALLRPCTWASWLTKSSAVHSSCCRPCWSLCWSPLKASLKQYRFISEKNKDISEGILFFYESIFTGCFGCAIIDGAFSANSFFQNWKSAMKKE